MDTHHHMSLKPYNTFGIDVIAKQFFDIKHKTDLIALLKRHYTEEIFVLGGGSNMLLTQDINKAVFHINLKGKKIISHSDNLVIVEANAGENWHEFVKWTLEQGFGGLENLSLIPGNVGTAPIQNIGAYGVELKDVFVQCSAIHRQTLEETVFSLDDCKFDYRQSIFKGKLKNQYIITSVQFRLTTKEHNLNTSYGSILQELEEQGITTPEPKDVSDAVIKIRQSKLPDPDEIGNSGSFFKNPVVKKSAYEGMKTCYPDMPSYTIDNTKIKIPAGWLIEQTGLKGYRDGDAGVHKKQALVLVNYGNASGKEIHRLSQFVQKEVNKKFGILLEPEVNVF